MAVSTAAGNQAVIDKLISNVMTETLIQESVMMAVVTNRSGEVGPEMDRLDMPLVDEMVVQDVSETVAVTPQTIVTSAAQLNLDQFKSIPFSLSDKLSVQAKQALVSKVISNGAKSLAHQIDSYILDLMYAGVSASAPDHLRALTVGNPLADIALARQLLNQQNVAKSDRFLIVGPEFESVLLKTETFISAERYGSVAPIQAAEIGRILGFTVVLSNDDAIIDAGFVATHRDAAHFARQIQPRLKSEEKVLEHRTDYSLSHLYGAALAANGAKKFVIFDADGTV